MNGERGGGGGLLWHWLIDRSNFLFIRVLRSGGSGRRRNAGVVILSDSILGSSLKLEFIDGEIVEIGCFFNRLSLDSVEFVEK